MNKHKDDEILVRYQRAAQLIRPAYDWSAKASFNTTVYPYWIDNSDCFWYERECGQGIEYRLVDAKQGTNIVAFDHRALALALEEISGEAVDNYQLPITGVDIHLEPSGLRFSAFGRQWEYLESSSVIKEVPSNSAVSPDGQRLAFVRDYNIWLRDMRSHEERQLTHDGQRFYEYAGTPSVYGRSEQSSTELLWSPNSKSLFTLVTDNRQVKPWPTVVQHVATDGVKPTIIDEGLRAGAYGDEHIETYTFLSINIDSGQIQPAAYRPCPTFYPPYIGYFSSFRGWWSRDSRRAYFIDLERGGLMGRLLEFDTTTGICRTIIEEKDDVHVTFIPHGHLSTLIHYLPESDELIWYSERSGWAHLYLYDLTTGTLKNAITEGEWMVRALLHVDTKRRELFIKTAGRVEGRNPYYCDICRVNMDTGEMVPVLSTDHEYVVRDQRCKTGSASLTTGLDNGNARGVSPSASYIVATRSRTDQMPVSLLLDRDGNELQTIETGVVNNLPDNWQWPEPIILKAADGKTDIYAVVYRPSDFSPDKVYPVLDCSRGDDLPVGSFSNGMGGDYIYFPPAACAELGFIAVMVASRGTCFRSKAFRAAKESSGHFCVNLPDHLAALKQLAERYPYMDLSRVGIGVGSSGALAVYGLLKYPEFYKVGVCLNGFLDWRLAGAFVEEYFSAGLPSDDDDKAELCKLVGNLEGKLLLMHGMLDNCIPVAATFRLVEALQEANKDFDLLIMPNLGHGTCKYTLRRSWDYLVRHLQGEEPPKEFDLRASDHSEWES